MSKKIVSGINSETKQGEGPKSVTAQEERQKKSAFCKSQTVMHNAFLICIKI